MSDVLDRLSSFFKGGLQNSLGGRSFNTASHLPVLYQIMPELKRLLKQNSRLGLLFIDLVDFSSFAERYGGRVADKVLKLIGQVLAGKSIPLHWPDPLGISAPSAILAPVSPKRSHIASSRAFAKDTSQVYPILPCTQGGDEFMLFYADPPKKPQVLSELSTVGEFLLDQIHFALIRSRFQLPTGGKTRLGVHLGYAEISHDENRSPEARIYDAVKEASLMAKSPLTPEDFLSREDILCIIENRELTQVYQPIVSLKDGSVFGVEALTRGPKGTRYEQPMSLFAHARIHNLLFRLEEVCRKLAVQNAKPFLSGQRLFLNIDPAVVLDPDFKGGTTRVLLAQYGLTPSDVVLELTERSAIKDYEAFRKTLAHYRKQGYAVAIDDVGSGYSSLEAVLELRPSFIKIDRSLISGVHISAAKRKIVKALAELSSDIRCFSIAEGVEDENELEHLMKAGIDFAQGYLLAKPSYPPSVPKAEQVRKIRSFSMGLACPEPRFPVQDLVRPYVLLSPDVLVKDLAKSFSDDPYFRSVVVGKSNHRSMVMGLIMRGDIMDRLASQYGYAVYAKKTLGQLLAGEAGSDSMTPSAANLSVLVPSPTVQTASSSLLSSSAASSWLSSTAALSSADSTSAPQPLPWTTPSLTSDSFGLDSRGYFWTQSSTSVESLAQALASRSEVELGKDVLVFQDDTLVGLLDVRTIVEHLAKVQIQDALNANPLTGLPGNTVIEATIKRRFESGSPLSVIYIDLDDFKSFNDKYGFERGDQVILATSKIIREAAVDEKDLVGHIGGDDFVVVSTPERAQDIAKEIIDLFDREIPSFYDEEDRIRGHVLMKDRDGVFRRHCIMTISIAIVPSSQGMRSHIEFSEKAAELKTRLKESHAKSSFRKSSILTESTLDEFRTVSLDP